MYVFRPPQTFFTAKSSTLTQHLPLGCVYLEAFDADTSPLRIDWSHIASGPFCNLTGGRQSRVITTLLMPTHYTMPSLCMIAQQASTINIISNW
jgi:hypothetical protein